MAKRKKITPLQAEFNKQVKRLKRGISKAEKEGWIIPENVIPKKPKRITKKSVERLKKISPTDILVKSKKLDNETGELIPGGRALKEKRSESAKKAAKTRKKKKEQEFKKNKEKNQRDYYNEKKEEYADFTNSVISEYIRQISRFPKKVATIVINALNRAIEKHGKDEIAYRLQFNSEKLSEYLNNIGLFGDSIQAILAYCDAVFGDMPGIDDNDRYEISDIIDSESYSE